MVLAWMLSWCLIESNRSGAGMSPGITGQDPHDPLMTAPDMSGQARLQYGRNVVPATWSYSGVFSEPTSTEDRLKRFHIVTVSRPITEPKRTVDPESFAEVPCDFIGTTPVVSVFSQDGRKHRFTVDTGAVRTYMRATTARALNFGREDPLPMCLYLPNDTWIHFKSEVDRSIAVLAVPNPDFPVEGILGMNALECCQVKVDFKQRKLWLRVSPKALDVKPASTELGVGPTSQISNPIVTIPIKRRESGRFSLEASIGGKNVPLEIDTGANLIGLSPASIPALKLEKVGEGDVLVENGLKPLSKFIAPDTTVGEIRFLWPVIREGVDPKAELGGFGPSVSPHQVVIVDYPGLRLLTLRPTEEESVEQAMSQFISGTARIQKDTVLIDMPDVVGTARTVLKKIQDQTAATVLHDLRLLAKGNWQARQRLMALYKQVCARKGTITIEQAGTETTIEIGHSGN